MITTKHLIPLFLLVVACSEQPIPVLLDPEPEYELPPYVTIIDNRKKQVEFEYSPDELRWRKETIKENRLILDTLRGKGAAVYYSKRGVVVNLSDILFNFDKANLKPAAQSIIRDIAEISNPTGRNLSIEGHTDSIGSVMYNEDLALRRAENVAQALKDNGIASDRIRVRSYGKGNPIMDNETSAHQAINRRVEIVIENKEYSRID
ncbi:MAG: OmpA family protein [Deltaproteobacteria bacterium]|jgi:outer membrane protein OmpA-like peptidoglycan-associated protein|nr:OmpA family protein [Deltaproteobacteria bacterium]